VKALWAIFVLALPFLGIFVERIARGSKMQENAVQDAQHQKRCSMLTCVT